MKRISVVLTIVLILTACDDRNKKNAVMPTFRGFMITWKNPYDVDIPSVGDTVTFTAVQKTLGDLIYDADYTWKVTANINGNDSVYTHTKADVVYDYDKSDPSIMYKVPAGNDGKLTVSFTGAYDFSATCRHIVNDVGHDAGFFGSIATSSSALLGRASGTYTFSVNTH